MARGLGGQELEGLFHCAAPGPELQSHSGHLKERALRELGTVPLNPPCYRETGSVRVGPPFFVPIRLIRVIVKSNAKVALESASRSSM
jgi:hypothetical protein